MVRMERGEVYRDARGKQETTNARLLGWLLAYPGSSTQELASAFDLHPTTVYRRLAHMLAAGWLQRVTGYGGHARFLLTSRGTSLLAQVMQQDTNQLVCKWQRGLNSPARLVPRLLTIDRIHSFARHFFLHAPQALARQGHAVVVRWHVMRDWRARFEVTQSRAITVQAQGVLVWTVTGSRRNNSHTWATDSKQPEEATWQTAFLLLESGLCDATLIASRLQTLLCYRAALQRECGSEALIFAPILVLVENERQAEVWRRAARQVARCENAEPQAGAIAIISRQENPWQWTWRDLATGAHVRLATHFAPLAPSSLPQEVLAHLTTVQYLMRVCERRNEVTEARPGMQIGSMKRSERQASLTATSHVLSQRQRELLTLLARTPQMTADEIAAVLPRIPDGEPLAPASAERLLRELARQHLIERNLVAQGQQADWRWHLTESGLRQVAAMHNTSLLHLRWLVARHHFVMQRQAAHQAGVYGVVAAFHRAAQATKGEIIVVCWDCGRGAERTYHYHGVQRNLRPDAELELIRHWQSQDERSSRLRLWIEYDSGTMNRRDLERKMAAYRDYWASEEWAAEGLAALPRLLFVVPEYGQEQRVHQACLRMLAGVRIRVLVTTAAHLQASTPFGHIWRQILPALPEGEQTSRRTLFE